MRLEVVELMGHLGGLGSLEPDTAKDRDLVVAALSKIQLLPPAVRNQILRDLGPLPADLQGIGDLGGWIKNLSKKIKKTLAKAAPVLEAAGAIGIPGASLLAKAANKAQSRGPLQPATSTGPSPAALPMTTSATPAALTAPAAGGAAPGATPGGRPAWLIPAVVAAAAALALLMLKRK